MRKRLLPVLGVVGVILAVIVLLKVAPAGSATPQGSRTGWGDPDLQGIWTDEYQTPLQRPARYATKELFTDEERAELDRQRAGILRRDQRVERGSERDVAGAYNAVFQSIKHTGKRTSLVVDPPDGRIPALTPEAKKRNEPRTASSGWRCCSPRRPARTRMPRAPAGSTGRRRRRASRGAAVLQHGTTRIASTAPRTAA